MRIARCGVEGASAAESGCGIAASGRRAFGWCLAAVVAAATLVVPAAADAQRAGPQIERWSSPTLKRIQSTGVVRVGYRENSPPFAFLDAKGKPIGYSLDICEVVVDAIAREVDREVRVEYKAVTPENRFDLVTSGAIDLECGSSTNTAERRKSVAFSPTMFVTGTKLLVRRGSGIRSLRDLDGKTVVLTRGTVHETAVPKIAERQKLKINFVFGADHNESFKILADGKADAFANDDVQLYGMLADKKAAADFRVVGDFLTYADYALMFRRDD
ncbi:MAG TPA: amino acid ABC transporter substrate-binding protein, partial [Casimicrobiaceae bacterium]|nr:amino acid ABC transporter substrate-binding protein [Casimicrobiaceae bacterium]